MPSAKPVIRIVRTSSREQNDLLPGRIEEFQRAGVQVIFDDLPADPSWAYVAAPADLRARLLTTALLENETTVVMCARGGYGASDLLPLLPWERLRKAAARPKILVGFSDTSALHSALWHKLGWPGIHGPMPATSLWAEGAIENPGVHGDITRLLEIIHGRETGASITLESIHSGGAGPVECRGWLFGGCFSVLTNLIGTPYLPASLDGAILFFEDIGEHPARLVRFLNQWSQAGLLKGVRGVIWGTLTQLGQNIPDNAPFVYQELARRLGEIPCWKSRDFGHVAPNWPLGIGADARISHARDGVVKMQWNLAKPLGGVVA
ncbi:MAG: hypothetical protein RIQ81_2320 [Pseudomonadota bacterium]|jgi:muramoyltetrapeptide carboxypeptidase